MIKITRKFLQENRNCVFVFGDNLLRKGFGGAATLRDEPNTYGFITKKFPDNDIDSFYSPKEYSLIFEQEFKKLVVAIETNKDKVFLISKLGSGLANKFNIFETIIEPKIKELNKFENVEFLF